MQPFTLLQSARSSKRFKHVELHQGFALVRNLKYLSTETRYDIVPSCQGVLVQNMFGE